jgi:transcriptional regulator GlxA family with amidase domain
VARVVIAMFEGAQTLDVTGPAEVFATATRSGEVASYKLILASIGGGMRGTSSGVRVETADLARIRPARGDVVIVVGGPDAPIRDALRDAALVAWVRRAAAVVRVLASVCSGAFVLGAAGVLDGRRAATHWSACAQLARAFPQVTVDANAIFVQDGHVWTSAGVTTGIDMALALVEADHGRALADEIAARLVLYVRRPGFQSQWSEALVAQTRGDDPLGPAIAWARANLARADVESLAERAALSVRTLHRRCLDTLGTTPARLIDKLRVERARGLLETREIAAKRLAVECGFGTTARMNRAFERELGMVPRAYRELHGPRG